MPNHVLQRIPTHGSTSKATPIYKGCLTTEYGPVVISSFRGILVRINITDHPQFITPGIKISIEIMVNAGDGPPTVK